MDESKIEAVDGVQFEVFEGKRSSQAAGKHVFARAAAAADLSLASQIKSQSDWRKRYLSSVRRLVEAGARSPKDALRIASDGLVALHDSFVFMRGGERQTLHEALAEEGPTGLRTGEIRGQEARSTQLVIPYRGEELQGDGLLRQLGSWEEAGIIEPSCGDAVRLVAANPDWLDLSDLRMVLLGAASEMGPLEWLCRWGAEVVAVDLPRPELWDRIISVARKGAGIVRAPVRNGSGDDLSALRSGAGADLLIETPEVKGWLSSLEGPMVVGNYAYAGGSTFPRVAAALDALTEALQKERADVSLSYLATPTDVFAVTPEIVQGALAGTPRRGPLSRLSRMTTAGRTFRPNYHSMVEGEDGRSWGISDALVPQQGANYALAKMLQRWRATVSRDQGHVTSANVAPATLTRSVVKNRVLAAAYRGASAFGVEIFGAATSRALMSALLVHDLRNPKASSQPERHLDHPYELFTEGAAHGGLWRLPYESRSVLPLAVGLGLLKRS